MKDLSRFACPRTFLLTTLTVLALGLAERPALAVVLDDEDPVDVVLEDGTAVRLYRAYKNPPSGIPKKPAPDLEGLAKRTVGLTDRQREAEEKARELGLEPVPRPAFGAGSVAKLGPVLGSLKRGYAPASDYYYLPTNLRISKGPDGTPEFLFLKFTTEARESEGGASGAIMHFLMTWGLTSQQEAAVLAELKKKDPGARLRGAVPLEPAGETGSFRVFSATLSDDSMAQSVVTSGKAPLLPGGKAAVAARLTATGAQLLAAAFEKTSSITDVSIELDYSYQTLSPGAKGSVTFDWDKLLTDRERIEADWTATTETHYEVDCYFIFCAVTSEDEVSYSYEEMQEHFRFLEEHEVIHFDWQETVREGDERIEKVREAFFQFFLDKMAAPTEPAPGQGEGEDEQQAQAQPKQEGPPYHFKREAVESVLERGTEVFSLEARFSVRQQLGLVGNLSTWYDEVRDNPKCVASVNLNDPFFQHRDIHFILDLDARDMFDEEVNYVTVNVRKKRDTGNDFEDHVTIDARYIDQQGINSTLTYARGEDSNPETYEYQAQWSLRGGHLYPPRPQWTRGSWEGVTLAPPVVPRTIEVEGSLEDMLASGVTRLTVQIHYPKFGEEVEENIHLSPARGESLVEHRIFVDRNARGYAYRLIVNHKQQGKLVLPWSPMIGDDYIYASIPVELFEEGSQVHEEAKSEAIRLIDSAKQKVLDQFGLLLEDEG